MRTDRKVLIALGLFMVVMGGLWTIGPLVFAGRDDPTAIDNKAVRTTVESACTQFRSDLSAIPEGIAPAERAEAENRAVEQLIGRVRMLSPEGLARDEPVERWLNDWGRIVAARRQAVQENRRFATPVDDGAPINVRMYALVRSGLETCDVPPALLAPEPGRV
ncbi:MAG TPA: hypothetical protein VG795_15860 [Acidimicrobiia bacterium]|nr:hypothetical protein [Acidimicrobiia bacterium]